MKKRVHIKHSKKKSLSKTILNSIHNIKDRTGDFIFTAPKNSKIWKVLKNYNKRTKL